MHLHQLQLLAFSAEAQASLQMLLSYFAKTLKPDEPHPSSSIVQVLKSSKQELKECQSFFTNPSNRDLVYKDFRNDILNDYIEIEKMDTSLLKDILNRIQQFQTAIPAGDSNSSCMNADRIGHHNKCCTRCNHTGDRCECSLSKSQCESYQSLCCTKCNLCFYCLMVKTNVTKWLELIQKYAECQLKCGPAVHSMDLCENQELRISIDIISIYQNMTCQLTKDKCKEMDQDNFVFQMLPGIKNWSSIHPIVSYATRSILRFLHTKNFITQHKYDTFTRNLKDLSELQSAVEVLEMNEDKIKSYIQLENMVGFMSDITELNKAFYGENQTNLEPLTISFTITNLPCEEKIDLKSALTRSLKKCFSSSIDTWMECQEGLGACKLKIEKCQPRNQNNDESLTLKFKIQQKSSDISMKAYEDNDSEISERLWKNVQLLVKQNIACENVFLVKWKHDGSLAIHVYIEKSDPWTENETIKVIETSLPNISDGLGQSYKELAISAFLVEQKNVPINAVDMKFKISPNKSKYGEQIHQFDVELLKQLFQQALINEGKSLMNIKAIDVVIESALRNEKGATATIKKAETIESANEDAVNETAKQDETIKPIGESNETTKQDEVTKSTTQHEITESTKQYEVDKTIRKDEFEKLTKQNEAAKPTKQKQVTKLAKTDVVTKMAESNKPTKTKTQGQLTIISKQAEAIKTTRTGKAIKTSISDRIAKKLKENDDTNMKKRDQATIISQEPKVHNTSKRNEVVKTTKQMKVTSTKERGEATTTSKTTRQKKFIKATEPDKITIKTKQYDVARTKKQSNVTKETNQNEVTKATNEDVDTKPIKQDKVTKITKPYDTTKIAKNGKLLKVAKQTNVTHQTKQYHVTKPTLQIEFNIRRRKQKVTKETKQDKVSESTNQDKVTESTNQDQVTETTKKDEITKLDKTDEIENTTKPDGVIKITKQDEVIKSTNKDKVTKSTKQDEVEKSTNKDEVNKTTKQDEVETSTNQDQVTETTKKDEITKLDKIDEFENTTKPDEVIKTTKQDEVIKSTTKDKVTKSTKQDEVEKSTNKDVVKKTTKQDEVETSTNQDQVTETTKKDEITKLNKTDEFENKTKPDGVIKTTKQDELETSTNKDENPKTTKQDEVETSTNKDKVNKTTKQDEAETSTNKDKVNKTTKQDKVETSTNKDEVNKTTKQDKVAATTKVYRNLKTTRQSKIVKATISKPEKFSKITKPDEAKKTTKQNQTAKEVTQGRIKDKQDDILKATRVGKAITTTISDESAENTKKIKNTKLSKPNQTTARSNEGKVEKTKKLTKGTKTIGVAQTNKQEQLAGASKVDQVHKTTRRNINDKATKPGKITKTKTSSEETRPKRQDDIKRVKNQNLVTKTFQKHEVDKLTKLDKNVKTTKQDEANATSKQDEFTKTAKLDGVTKSTRQEEAHEITKQKKVDKATMKYEVDKINKQAEVTASTKQSEIIKSIKQDEATKTTKQDELDKTIKQHEVTKTTKQDKVSNLTKQDEEIESIKRDEFVKTTTQHEVTKTTKQDEIFKSFKQDKVSEVTKTATSETVTKTTEREEVNKATKQNESIRITKQDVVTKSTEQHEVEKKTKQDEVIKSIKQDKVRAIPNHEAVTKTTKQEEVDKTTKQNESIGITKQDRVENSSKQDEVTNSTKQEKVTATSKQADWKGLKTGGETTSSLRTDFWYKINLGLEHLHQPLLDILHNNKNDARYNGLPEDECLLHQRMSTFKQSHEKKLRGVIRKDQWELLCSTNGNTSDSKQWDATLIIVVCKNLLTLPKDFEDIIEDSRIARNKVKHKTLHDLQDKTEFVPLWNDIKGILDRCNSSELNEFDKLGRGSLRFYESDAIKFLERNQEQLNSEKQTLKNITHDEANSLQKQIEVQRRDVYEAISQLQRDFNITEKRHEEITSNFERLTSQMDSMKEVVNVMNKTISENFSTVNQQISEIQKTVNDAGNTKGKSHSFNCTILNEVVDILIENLSEEEMEEFVQPLEAIEDPSTKNLSKRLRKQKLQWDKVKDELENMDRSDLVDLIKSKTNITKGFQLAIKKFKENIQTNYLERYSIKPFLNKDGSDALDGSDIDDIFVELAITSDGDTVENAVTKEAQNHQVSLEPEKTDVSLQELASISMREKLISIDGIAGIGKSTLVKKMVSDWYEGKLFNGTNGNRVHFLLPILCRELNDQYEDIPNEKAEDLIQRIFPDIPDFILLQDLGCNVLIIVDGIDELRGIDNIDNQQLPSKVNLISKLLDRKFMKQLQCIIVGRPHITNQLASYRKKRFCYPTTKIQICGFSENSAKKFVYKQFNDQNNKNADEVLQKIKQSEVTEQMSTIPLYMQILVSIFKDDPLEKIPSRTTELLLYCVLVFWRNHCERKNNSPRVSLRKFIETINLTSFMDVFKFSYETLQNKKIIFEADENDSFNELVGMGILLKSTKGESGITTYQFLHLTFQELFAAFHILCDENGFDTEHQHSTKVIAAGIQGISYGNGNFKDSILFYFLQKVKENFHTNIMVEQLKLYLNKEEQYELSQENCFIDCVFEHQDVPQLFLQHNVIIKATGYDHNLENLSYMIDLISKKYPHFRFQVVQSCYLFLKVVNLTKELRISYHYISSDNVFAEQFALNLTVVKDLKHLQLSHCSLKDGTFSVLLNSIVNVESLDVSGNELTQLSCYRLLKRLAQDFPLKEIDFSRNKFVDDHFDEIEQSNTNYENQLINPATLTKINLRDCSITDEVFSLLQDQLLHVEIVDVSENKITLLSIYSLLNLLTPESRLKVIYFERNTFAGKHCDNIDQLNEKYENKVTNINISELRLNSCSLTNEHFSLLLDFLVNVERVNVSCNKLTQLSINRLFKRLTPDSQLKNIDFSSNTFVDAHFDEIDQSNTIDDNKMSIPMKLSNVSLMGCSLTDESFSVLLDSLVRVESIDVSLNELTQLSFYHLFKRLTPYSSLKVIDFSLNKFVYDHFDEIDESQIKENVVIDKLIIDQRRAVQYSQVLPIWKKLTRKIVKS